jgi:hypothetical protein
MPEGIEVYRTVVMSPLGGNSLDHSFCKGLSTMLYTWRRRHLSAAFTPSARARRTKPCQRRWRTLYLELLEPRNCPTTLTPQPYPDNISQLQDNQTDQTIAISPVAYDPVNHFRHVWAASTNWHGGFDGASYYVGSDAPYDTNGLFFRRGHMDSTGQITWDGEGIMATGWDNHEPGYGLPAATHFPHATFDKYDNLFVSYMTGHEQARGTGTTQQYGNTLTDNSAHWFPNEWAGKYLTFNNQSFAITGNTSNTLTFSPYFQYYQPWTWYYTITLPPSTSQDMEVVQSTDGGTFTWQLDGPPAHPQNFAWLASYFPIATGPYGPLQPTVATGPGFGTQLSSGTTTGGNSATTLNDTTQSWTPHAFAGDLVAITSGTGQHQAAVIQDNSATQLTISPAWGIIPIFDPITPSNTSAYAIGTQTNSLWVGFENTGGRPAAVGTKVSGLGFSAVSPLNFNSQIQLPAQPQTYITVSGFAVGPAGQVMISWLTQKYGFGEQPPKARIFTATASGLIDTSFNDPISPPENPAAYVNMPMDGYYHQSDGNPIPANAPGIIDANPHIAYDNNVGSPHYGRAYLAYTDVPDSSLVPYPDDSNIYVKYSDNNGLVSWTAGNGGNPVNDDGGHSTQFGSQLAVQIPNDASSYNPASGNLAVIWYDARFDPGNVKVALEGTVSTDGGNTFATNTRITPPAPIHGPPPLADPQGLTNGPLVDLQDQGTITGVSGTSLTDGSQHWIYGATASPPLPTSSAPLDWWQAWTPPLSSTLTPKFWVTAPSPYAGQGNTYASIADNNLTTLSLIDNFGPPNYAWSNGIPTVGSPYWITARGVFAEDLGRYIGVSYLNGAFYASWSDNSNSTLDNPTIDLYSNSTYPYTNWTLNDYFSKVTVSTSSSPGGGHAPALPAGSSPKQPTPADPGPVVSTLPGGSPTATALPLVLGPSLLATIAPSGTGQPSAVGVPATGQPSAPPSATLAPVQTLQAQAVDRFFALWSQVPFLALTANSSFGAGEPDPLGDTSFNPDRAFPVDSRAV